MAHDSALGLLVAGLLRLLRLFWKFTRSRLRMLLYLLRWRKRPRKVEYRDCIRIPDERNLRPDPYIYSQEWLKRRGLAYTWDNPDISVIDTTSGQSVGRHDLLQGRPYEIRARISNHSFTVPALDTLVLFKIKAFGANAGTLLTLPSDTVDVPNGGSVTATTAWTPDQAGHFCIKVIIVHSNDANALNNVGQHNTDVARSGEEYQRQIVVENDRQYALDIEMMANAYMLPERPMRAKSVGERNSAEYLRQLRQANEPGGFPPGEGMGLVIDPIRFTLRPQEKRLVQIKLGVGFSGQVNIDALAGSNVLLGGVTIIKET